MVFNEDSKDFDIKIGQEKRDFIRLNSLENNGYTVYSLDDKHDPINGRHCNANFNDPRRMIKSIQEQLSYPVNLEAQYIILDYFFSPVQR